PAPCNPSLHDALPIWSLGILAARSLVGATRARERARSLRILTTRSLRILTTRSLRILTARGLGILATRGLPDLRARRLRAIRRADRKSTRLNSSHVSI